MNSSSALRTAGSDSPAISCCSPLVSVSDVHPNNGSRILATNRMVAGDSRLCEKEAFVAKAESNIRIRPVFKTQSADPQIPRYGRSHLPIRAQSRS